MIIIPAVDLLGGSCVRLLRGDYRTAERVAADPIETARAFMESGAVRLHVVDLDGAKKGGLTPENYAVLTKLASIGLSIDCGGGIRTEEHIEAVFCAGVKAVTLGSAAVKNPLFAQKMIEKYGAQRIIIGIDAYDGIVKTDGWTIGSGLHFIEFAKTFYTRGARNFIYTDIDRDGTMSGPNTTGLTELMQAVPDCIITASGGVRDIGHIEELRRIGCHSVIVGKALYAGTLNLREAIERGK